MLKITPHNKIVGSMPTSEEEETPVLLALQDEPVGTDTVKLSIELTFQRVPVKRPLSRGYWYLASTGADIELRATGAKIIGHTPGSRITVKYTLKGGKERRVGGKIKPALKLGEDIEVSTGELSTEGRTTEEEQAEYVSHEELLAVARRGDTVIWQQSMSRGQKAVRDFLFGNLALWADCKWPGKNPVGRVRLRTSTFFFDDGNKRLSRFKALVAEFTLADQNHKIPNRDGIEIHFAHTDK